MAEITKYVKLQISGDDDAVNAAIKTLHRINFINGAMWSNAIRKRSEHSVIRVASRSVRIGDSSDEP
jgi:hypothetical protein